jgi:hypothetical protein
MPEKENVNAAGADVDVDKLTQALAAPFDLREVKFKPGVVSGNRALALAYVDARVIQDRLDEVLGVTGWQDEYDCLPDGSVVCRLHLRLGAEWITKMDVGGQSEQPDEGDRRKAAFSDALKRAAVKFGIGRYLYRLPPLWVDYDPHKRQFTKAPTLPPGAVPAPAARGGKSGRAAAGSDGKKDGAAADQPAAKQPAAARQAPARPAPEGAPNRNGPAMPASGADLRRRLNDYDARLAKQGVCRAGELVQHVVQAGVKAGYDADLATWAGPAIALAVEETKAFEAQRRRQPVGQKEVA